MVFSIDATFGTSEQIPELLKEGAAAISRKYLDPVRVLFIQPDQKFYVCNIFDIVNCALSTYPIIWSFVDSTQVDAPEPITVSEHKVKYFDDFNKVITNENVGIVSASFHLGKLTRSGLDLFLATVSEHCGMILLQDLVYVLLDNIEDKSEVAKHIYEDKFYKIKHINFYEQEFAKKDLTIAEHSYITCETLRFPNVKIYCWTWLLASNKDREVLTPLLEEK